MGADSVLVNAAFKEAATKYGGDVINMKPLYDSNVANMNKAFTTINSAMDIYSAKKELDRAGVRKQLEGFQTQVNAGVKDMYAQDEPMHEAFIGAFRGKILGLQDEFEAVNTYGKGDTQENAMARVRIEGELKRVINQAHQFRGKTEVFFDNLKNVDPGNVHGPSVAAHQQALNFKDYDRLLAEGKIEVRYGKDGIEIISRNYNKSVSFGGMLPKDGKFIQDGPDVGEDVVVTLASLNENFRPTDVEHHAGIMADVNDYTKSGELQGSKAKVAFDANGEMVEFNWNEAEAISNFTRQVDSKINFDNVVGSKVKGLYEVETSFKASLEKNINISVGVLQNMFVDENGDGINDIEVLFNQLDRAGGKDGGDGVIDEKDLAAGEGIPGFERNLDAIIDALTNTDNPAFNMKTSAPMLGAFLAEAAKGRSELAFNTAAGSRKDKTDDNPNTQQTVWAGVDLNASVATIYTDEGSIYVKGKDMKNTADTILNIEKKGAGFFEGYDGVNYTYKGGKWSILSYNKDTQLQESKPYDRANMLRNLKFSDKPQMLEYLKKVDAENNPITDYKKEGGKWYYIKGGQKKEVSAGNFERLEAQALIAEARAKK
jgi:hypothetical protein